MPERYDESTGKQPWILIFHYKNPVKNSLEPYEIDIIEYVNANENNGIRKDPDNNGYLNTCVVCGQEFHTASKRIAKYCKIRRTHHCDKCGFEWDVICSGNSKRRGLSECPKCNNKPNYDAETQMKECSKCKHVIRMKMTSSIQYCSLPFEYTCKQCGRKFVAPCDGKEHKWCSDTCAAHSDDVRRKYEQTSIERFGYTSNMKNPELCKELLDRQRANNGGKLAFNTGKEVETNIKRYGYARPAQNPEIAKKAVENQKKKHGGKLAFNTDKQRTTMIERYGAPTTWQSDVLMEKCEQTMMEKYGSPHPSLSPEILAKIIESNMKHGQLFGDGSPVSKRNKEFKKKIETIGDIEMEHHVETAIFDLFIPDCNVAIEINPTVTHNTDVSFACLRNQCGQPCDKHKPHDATYHNERALLAWKHGINLIQIYDWNDENKIADYIMKLCNHDSITGNMTFKQLESYDFPVNPFINDNKKQAAITGMYADDMLIACIGTTSDGMITGFDCIQGEYMNAFKLLCQHVNAKTGIIDLNLMTDKRMIGYYDNHDENMITMHPPVIDDGLHVVPAGMMTVNYHDGEPVTCVN